MPFTDNKNLDSLYPFFEDTSYLNILLHLETRSGNYVYPYLDQVLDLINNSKIVTHNLNLLVFSTLKIKSSSFFINNNKIRNFGLLSQKNHKGESYEFTVIKTANKNNIIIVDPKNISFKDQINFIEKKINLILAINSFLWPISRMLNKNLIGIHYLDSSDGHQFIDKNTLIITPSKNTFLKTNNSILAIENIDYARIKENPLMVEYTPSTIYGTFIKGYNFYTK